MDTAKIYAQHEENVDFLKRLEFYKEEIKILSGRLEEVAGKNSAADCLVLVERFQNQLIVQRNNIDEIRHEVKQDENRLEAEINENETAVDRRSLPYHEREAELMAGFEKNFNDLRQDMKEFFSKWM